MKPQIISSQDYLDPDIVKTKRREKDFDVFLSPEFDYEGRTFQIVLDGHHSLEAARQSRRKPRFFTTKPNEIEGFTLTGNGDDGVAEFLQMHYNGSDWRNIATNGPATWGPPKKIRAHMPTLRQRYEKAKENAHRSGRKALGKPPRSEQAKAYRSARAEYHRLGEALMRQSRGEVRGTPRKRRKCG